MQDLCRPDKKLTLSVLTESLNSNQLFKIFILGKYRCACCSAELFSSDHKFDSGTGWPSFFDTASSESVSRHTDKSLGMIRVEVLCRNCDAHLGEILTFKAQLILTGPSLSLVLTRYLNNNVLGLFTQRFRGFRSVGLCRSASKFYLETCFQIKTLIFYFRSCI